MGNRAVITAAGSEIGVYLHWNGGPDSVKAFLTYCKAKGYRSPDTDNYGWARLCQVIGNFFGGELSLGIDVLKSLDTDNGDNGTYIIKGWKIVERKYRGSGNEGYDLGEFLNKINESMPENERLTTEQIAKAVAEANE